MKKLTYLFVLIVVVAVALPILLQPESLEDRPSQGASIKIYGANVWGFRGYFAVHTWVATRAEGERQYKIDQIIGWRLRRTGTAHVTSYGSPNQPWFGNQALLLHEVSGTKAQALVPKVRAAINSYPYASEYTMFPGPNSNSFTQWVGLAVPELELNLPMKAIGRLWMKQNYPQT